MEFIQTHKLPLALGLGVFLCLLLISGLRGRVSGLEELTDLQARQINALHSDVVLLKKELLQLREIQKRALENKLSASEQVIPEIDLKLLREGLHVLETEIRLESAYHTVKAKRLRATIYHLKTRVAVGDFSEDINIGIATTGITSIPLFYIDYDGDGQVDQEMMERYVGYLPMGNLIRRSLNVRHSQEAYATFLLNSRKAEFLSVDKIKDKGGKVANGLWSFVEQQSENLARAIQSAMEEDSNSSSASKK